MGFSKSQILWFKNIDDEFFNVFNDIFQWQQKIHFFYWCLHNRIILVNEHFNESWVWEAQESVETHGTVESIKLKVKKWNENRFEWWLNWWTELNMRKLKVSTWSHQTWNPQFKSEDSSQVQRFLTYELKYYNWVSLTFQFEFIMPLVVSTLLILKFLYCITYT